MLFIKFVEKICYEGWSCYVYLYKSIQSQDGATKQYKCNSKLSLRLLLNYYVKFCTVIHKINERVEVNSLYNDNSINVEGIKIILPEQRVRGIVLKTSCITGNIGLSSVITLAAISRIELRVPLIMACSRHH